ncbi:MAG: cache domain-containing protein [Methanoregula sp.]|nr:cache domain-containing protein [Methanoregula sp.]
MIDKISKVLGRVPLRTIIVVPFIILIVITVSLTGYISYRNSQQAVNDVTSQLRDEITARIEDNLHSFVATAYIITDDNQDAIDLGMLSMHDLPAWKSYLWHKVKNSTSISISATGNEEGEYFGVDTRENGQVLIQVADRSTDFNLRSYDTDSGGNTSQLLTGTYYDPRIRPWYITPAQSGKPAWAPIYKQQVDPVLQIALGVPVYDQQGRLQGVTAAGFRLSKISTFLEELKVGKTGKTYIVENSGLLVAASNKELPFIIQENGTALRLMAVESRDPLIRETAVYIENQPGGFAAINSSTQLDFEIGGKRQFVQVTPFRDEYGLDWKIVVVMPEADFMDQVQANNRTTLFLMGAALIGAILIGIFISRWVTRPIVDLNTAAKTLADGTWDHAAPVDRIDEVGELATSFNTMAGQIQKNLSALEIQVDELRKAEESLKRSHDRFRTVMNSLDALVYVADMQTYELLFVNEYGRKIWGDIAGKTCWKTIQTGQSGPCPFCTNSKLVDSSGNPNGVRVWEFQNTITNRWYECRDSAISWVDGRIVRLEIAMDITERKRAEDVIIRKSKELNAAYEQLTATEEELRHNYDELQRSQQALTLARKKLSLLNSVTFQDIQNALFSVYGYFELEKMIPKDEKLQQYMDKQIGIIQKIAESLKFANNYQGLGLKAPIWQNVQQSFILGISHTDISKLSRSLNVDGLEIFADPLLENAFFTFAENTIRHGKTATEIALSYHETDDGLVLIFEDNGKGIPNNMKEKIFEKKDVGTKGMGLFLASEILSITGIIITETGEPGKGARFEMIVPKGAYRFI